MVRPAHAAEDSLALVAQVRAEKRKQLDHDSSVISRGNLRACATSAARIADLGEEAAVALHELAPSSISSGTRRPRRGRCLALGLQAAVGRGARGHERSRRRRRSGYPAGDVGDDQGAQPVSEEVLQVLVGDPRCLVVEQQGDERLHRDSPDQAPLVAEPLVHKTAEALETRTGFGAQLGQASRRTGPESPSVRSASPGTSPQRSPWPAATRSSNARCRRASLPCKGFAGVSGAASRAWHASRAAPSDQRGTPAADQLGGGVAGGEEETSDRVAPHFVVRELRADLERVVGRGLQQPVAAEPFKRGRIDPAHDVQRIASAQREVGQTQERKLPGVWRAAIGSPLAADQPRQTCSMASASLRGVPDAAPDKQVHHHGPAEQFRERGLAPRAASSPKTATTSSTSASVSGGTRYSATSPPRAFGDGVPHELLGVVCRDGDDRYISLRAASARYRKGSRSLRYRVRAVDDQEALRSAEFREKRRERRAEVASAPGSSREGAAG